MFGRPPARWWNRPVPKEEKVCYRSKSNALRVFLDHNYRLVERWGGPDIKAGKSEFDAVNHKYGTNARTIAQAIWAALPKKRRPYCLTDIDLEALNDTSPAAQAEHDGIPKFELPEYVYLHQQQPRRATIPKLPPKNWKERCRQWRHAARVNQNQGADQCFTDRYGHEKCVCRYKGRFVSCGYVPGVPF
jgi:hypothetical protein